MHWRHLAEATAETNLLLPLAGAAPARAYLSQRLGLLQAEMEHPEAWARPRRLLDRSAAFWLVDEWLNQRGSKRGMVLLGSQAGTPGVRMFWLKGFEKIGNPWKGPTALANRVAFATDSIDQYGALSIPHPLTEHHLLTMYGAMAVKARQDFLSEERSTWLQSQLPAAEEHFRERF